MQPRVSLWVIRMKHRVGSMRVIYIHQTNSVLGTVVSGFCRTDNTKGGSAVRIEFYCHFTSQMLGLYLQLICLFPTRATPSQSEPAL